jgi:toxin ParE1/3/4
VERKVVFRVSAQADLTAILDYITDQAGPTIANSYVDRIERACRALATFSERGTRYDDVVPGLRAIGFEGRATMLFRVEPKLSISSWSPMAAATG